jgi:hypothetical protein
MIKDNEKNSDIISENEQIDSSNIFDDFTDDINLKEEIKEIVENQQKDSFYYILKTKKILHVLLILLLLFFILAYSYIYIQKSEKFNNSNILNPICFLIL